MTTATTEIQVGTELPPLVVEPISRTTLALFAGASGDHNPIHVDIDAAKAAGFDDVFAHGMLSMAYLGRLVTSWVPQSQLRALSTRFTSITRCSRNRRALGQSWASTMSTARSGPPSR